MPAIVLDPPNPVLFNPLLACTGNWTDKQKRAAVAALGIGDVDFNGQVLTPECTILPDVKREGTCVLFGSFHKRGHNRSRQNSEIYLQPELDYPRISGRKNSPKCGGLATDVWWTEVRTIERIE